MKRLFIAIAIICLMQTTLFAQSTTEPSQQFVELKKGITKASKGKQMKEASKQLDAFLSHISIGRSDGNGHNIVPFLTCSYDNMPLTTPAILRCGAEVDTIQFQDGRWYITKDLSPDMEIDLVTIENGVGSNSKPIQKTMGAMRKKYTFQLGEELAGKKGSLFYVRDESLYYAAIESKKIPTFSILSNSEVINYASCLKAILKASGIEASYDEIIRQYLNTTIDEKFVPTKGNQNTIAGRKVTTTFVPQTKVEATVIVNELVKERFMIAIDKDGNVGLLTAIALTGENNYQPVHVRMRLPTMAKEEQRVQMSWRDFSNRVVALVKVDIYINILNSY